MVVCISCSSFSRLRPAPRTTGSTSLRPVAPTGDYTAAERERLRASDPGVDGSPTSIVDSHFVRDLLANGAKPAPFAPAAEPKEWSEAVGVKLTDAKVRTIHGADVVATEAGLQPALQTEYYTRGSWRTGLAASACSRWT